MSWDDPGPDWECACGIAHVGITEDEKLIADSERLIEKCSELNKQFKSKHKDRRIPREKMIDFRKKVYDPSMQEYTASNDNPMVSAEEIKPQAVEYVFKSNKNLMSSAAKLMLMGILINHKLGDDY